MFVLFLILCYFILIFNIIVPTVGEKLRIEHETFLKHKQLYGDNYVCVKNVWTGITFTPFGAKAFYLTDKQGSLINCNTMVTETSKLAFCDNTSNFIKHSDICKKAYAEFFYSY